MKMLRRYKYLILLFLIILGVIFYLLWPKAVYMICSNKVYGKSNNLRGNVITQENMPDCMLIAMGGSCYNYQLDQKYKTCLDKYGVTEKKILNKVPR